ncbi:hypothetical protein BJ508DRAFT_334441, partial [Ascobolus immersus RN42]
DYLPGQIESKFHGTKLFPLNPTEKSPKSFFYIVDNDNSDLKKCMVRVVHFFQEVEPKGDQERKGILNNAQFFYDREWDYPYGISTNRFGSRIGKPKKGPNRSAARIRIGLVDKTFLPYDSKLNQSELRKRRKAQLNKIAKAISENKPVPDFDKLEVVEATDGEESDGELEPLLRFKDKELNKTAFSKTSRGRTFDPTTVYNALGELARRIMRERGFDKTTPKEDVSAWFDCLLDILEASDGILPYWVKEDLEEGAYVTTRVKNRQASRDATIEARRLDPSAAEVVVYDTDKGDRLPYTKQLWGQRRRFVWDSGYEVVMEGFREGLVEQNNGLEAWSEAMDQYHDYFCTAERAQQMTTKPRHPHLIDIADVKYPATAGTKDTTKRPRGSDDEKEKDDDEQNNDPGTNKPPPKKPKTTGGKGTGGKGTGGKNLPKPPAKGSKAAAAAAAAAAAGSDKGGDKGGKDDDTTMVNV